MDHADPIAAADQLLLLVGQIGLCEKALLILNEMLAEIGLDQIVQEVVDPERLYRAVDGERIGARQLFRALELR
jgi:hypothetical protein